MGWDICHSQLIREQNFSANILEIWSKRGKLGGISPGFLTKAAKKYSEGPTAHTPCDQYCYLYHVISH